MIRSELRRAQQHAALRLLSEGGPDGASATRVVELLGYDAIGVIDGLRRAGHNIERITTSHGVRFVLHTVEAGRWRNDA